MMVPVTAEEPDADDIPFNDAYESEHLFGVARCMLCSSVHDSNMPHDSAAHGYVECEVIQSQVWHAIMPTLKKLVGSKTSVPTDLRSIVLGWPDLPMPPSYRARLLLWRDIAIHLVARARWTAIRDGLQNDINPNLALPDFAKNHAALLTSTLDNAYHKCASPKRAAFVKKWIERGTFLKESHGALAFYQMSVPPATTTATT